MGDWYFFENLNLTLDKRYTEFSKAEYEKAEEKYEDDYDLYKVTEEFHEGRNYPIDKLIEFLEKEIDKE